jgi:uncharacterized membrane-anchored protein
MNIVRIATLRRAREPQLPGVSGVARLDRRTKNLTKRLRPGDIAIIDHADLDRVAAETLAERGVAAVINAATSISGRYPNVGPEILVSKSIPVLDQVGSDVFARVREGERVRLDGTVLLLGDEPVATGVLLTPEGVQVAMEQAREGLAAQLEAFADNTMEFLRAERDLLLDDIALPEIRTQLEGRQVLIVVRGYSYREDLETLRPYIREYRPALIGVDGGADALLEARYLPDIILGDMDSVSDRALTCGAEIIVHAYRDGRAPGLERVRALGLEAVVVPSAGTSEDVAMLLADDKGANLIVAVGTHATLVEFLDKGRAGMASTFLTRLRVGGKLVDAKGVSRLYRSRISTSSLLLLVAAALVTLGVVVGMSPVGQVYMTIFGAKWDTFVDWVLGLF